MINFKKRLAFLFSLLSFFCAAPVFASAPQNVGQLITDDITTSRMIIWQTTDDSGKNYVEYRPKNKTAVLSIKGSSSLLPSFDDSAARFQHHALITGLEPNTLYEYRAVSGSFASPWHTLKTMSRDNNFKAIIFGDSQCTDYSVWGDTVQTAYRQNGDAAFFVNMGDLVDNGQHMWQWQEWFKYAAPLLANVPAAPISGNHENYSLDWQYAAADLYNALFPLPQNGAPSLKNQCYSYDCGDVHFAVLDTQLEELRLIRPDLFTKQAVWLDSDLKNTPKPWKVVLMHRNTLSCDGKDAPTEAGLVFMPIFEKNNVDIVFTGHIHAYGRTAPQNGVIYIATGRSGNDVWDKPKQKQAEIVFDRLLDTPNYLTLERAADKLIISDYSSDGSLKDRLSLTK